jgi:hypothetical protein
MTTKRTTKMKLGFFSRIILLLVIIVICGSWGFLVHRTVNQLAVYELPEQMRYFFYKNRDYLVKEAPGPDMRRNSDPAEGPRHFIDIEAYGDSAAWKMPLHEEDAIRKYSFDTLKRYGYVPYEVLRMKGLLTAAFRKGDKDSILFYAADLGHYIGDANVPLHTTTNYDGQLSGQKGLHNLWESTIPDLEFSHYNFTDGHSAHYLSDPASAIWGAVRRSYSLLKDVFDQEKEVSKQFTDSTKYHMIMYYGRRTRAYTAAFAEAYNARLGHTVNDQLLHSADLIADFWYTAWVDAGSPVLNGSLSAEATQKDKQEYEDEYKAYKENKLLEKGLLLSRQPGVKD